eukprot:525497_1
MRSSVTKLGISTITPYYSNIIISSDSFSLDDFKQFDEIHFVIDIKILNEYDLEGNIIGANIENEWDKFLQKEQNINDASIATMSDSLKVFKQDYIDDKTKHIVNGFIKTIQNSYKISTIPSEIIIITLLYVDDHFMMDRGSFQWKINDSLLIQNILSADTQQEFTSNTFEVGKLGWMLQLIPNDNNGDFGVYLGSLSIPKTWNVCVCYIMKCKQLNMKFIFTETYKVGDNWGAPTFSFNDVININPKQLTFDVSMKIIRIMSNNNIKYQSKINNYRKNYQLKWTINNNQKYKQQDIYSDIVGGMFCGYYSLQRGVGVQ